MERDPLDENLSLRLPGSPDAAARARRELSRLRADLDPPLAETLRLLVTELVSNAVRHAAAETVSLNVLVGRAAVFTEVRDTGPGFDPGEAGVRGSNHAGWGLFLVQRLADRWGVAHEPAATRVWFELRRA
jgi:anti-sigma regulatory factor (Ser/Thr protein kinase)